MPRTKGAHGKHKKEKPIKEKKKRGRPPKQYQQQHQVVNVNVSGGGGGGGGSHTVPVPFQLPSTIYDPSLITPHYGINDRQPVNPLLDAASDLMTPLIQSIISNQAQHVPPIKEAVKPLNPVVKEPIKTPIIKTPITQKPQQPPVIPIPQKDQSHPIPPEVINPPNIELPINNKQKEKNLQKEIKPQTPQPTPLHDKYKLPPGATNALKKVNKKVNDPEGLGMKIPFGNVAELAANIGMAAATGGATAATESFLMRGGLRGVINEAEHIIAASVGAGVAGGVSTVAGNSTAGHIVSGVVGGIASRAASRHFANRTIPQPQQPPSQQQSNTNTSSVTGNISRSRAGRINAFAGTGNRLGGTGNRSRPNPVPEIVEPPPVVQETRDPATGARTRWLVPHEYAMDAIREAANRTMNRTAETVSNIRDQISNAGENILQRVRGLPYGNRTAREEIEAQRAVKENKKRNDASSSLKAAIKRNSENSEDKEFVSKRNASNTIKAALKRKAEGHTFYAKQIEAEHENLINRRNQRLSRVDTPEPKTTTKPSSKQQQTNFKADYTDEEFKRKEIQKLKSLQKKPNKTDIDNELLNALTKKYTGNNSLKKPDKKINESASKLQAAIKRRDVQLVINDILPEHRAASTLQATVKRSDVQPVINYVLPQHRAASTLQAAVKRSNILQPKEKTTNNFGNLSSGALGEQRKINRLITASSERAKQRNISNIGELTSKTLKRQKNINMMKIRQVVGEERLKQLEAAKDKKMKDEASDRIKAAIKRKQQPTIKQMKDLPQTLGAASKRLFTERINSSYVPAKKDANGNIMRPDKTVIWNKSTVGQPLAVSTRGKKLISKKRQTSAVEGWGHRNAYLDLAEQYKDIMTKGKKK
jgi:hypothetical protein